MRKGRVQNSVLCPGHRMGVYRQVAAAPYAVRGLLLLTATMTGGSILFGQTASSSLQPCPRELTQEAATCAVTLAPSEAKGFLILVPQGKVRMLTAEQENGTVELSLPVESPSGSDSQPRETYTNKAGLHSKIRILLSFERPSGQTILISNPSKKSATVSLTADVASAATAGSDQERSAEDAFARAEFLRSQGPEKSSEALADYDRSIAGWQAAGNPQERERALIWKAFFVFFKQNDYPAALSLDAEALKSVSLLEPVEAANCWKISGFINAQLAHYDSGAAAYNSALALFRTTGDLFNQEVVLDNLSKLERLQGKSEDALHDASRAATLAAAIGDPRRQLGVQEEIGAIYISQGDLESAYHAYEAALSLFKTAPDPRLEAYVWSDMGVLYTLMGDFARATDALEQATALWKTNPNPAGELNTLDDYGDLLLERNQPETARSYYTRGLELAEKSSNDRARIFLLRGTGKSYLLQGDTARAEAILQQALKLARDVNEGDSIAETLCLLGDAAWQRHGTSLANQYYDQCRQASISAHDSYTEIRAEGGLARAALQSGALESAQSHCETALGKIEAVREQLQTDNLKTLFFASLHSYYDLEIQILARLDRAHPNEGYLWQSFLIAERARARTLLDQVASTNGEVHAIASQPLLAQYEDIERRLRRAEAAAARLRGRPGTLPPAAVRAAIARLTVSEHQLQQEILATREAHPSIAPSPSLTLAALENALPGRNAALVEYWTGETASYAWSITRAGIRSYRLPPAAQIERQCAAFRKALLAVASRDPQLSAEQRAALQPVIEAQSWKLGAALAETLLPSGILLPSASTVLIVGDGPIESAPFAALPGISLTHQPKTPLRNVTFVNEPSAMILSLIEAKSPSAREMRLAIFTAEETQKDSIQKPGGELRRQTQGTQSNLGARSSELPFAAEESAKLREIFGSSATRSFSMASITPATLQNFDWSAFSIGHFAMHAVLNEKYAELTGLGDGQKAGSSNLLWYGDVGHIHANLDLVVLSACNSALGARVPGEGLHGLTQAFFAAGSQRVLGTLWEVDDQATSEWMQHFYSALKETHSPVKALHNAQEKMAEDSEWSSPYYWAGFVLAGDWRPLP